MIIPMVCPIILSLSMMARDDKQQMHAGLLVSTGPVGTRPRAANAGGLKTVAPDAQR